MPQQLHQRGRGERMRFDIPKDSGQVLCVVHHGIKGFHQTLGARGIDAGADADRWTGQFHQEPTDFTVRKYRQRLAKIDQQARVSFKRGMGVLAPGVAADLEQLTWGKYLDAGDHGGRVDCFMPDNASGKRLLSGDGSCPGPALPASPMEPLLAGIDSLPTPDIDCDGQAVAVSFPVKPRLSKHCCS